MPIMTTDEHSEFHTIVEISPETVFFYGIGSFILTVGICAAITFGGGYIEDWDEVRLGCLCG